MITPQVPVPILDVLPYDDLPGQTLGRVQDPNGRGGSIGGCTWWRRGSGEVDGIRKRSRSEKGQGHDGEQGEED